MSLDHPDEGGGDSGGSNTTPDQVDDANSSTAAPAKSATSGPSDSFAAQLADYQRRRSSLELNKKDIDLSNLDYSSSVADANNDRLKNIIDEASPNDFDAGSDASAFRRGVQRDEKGNTDAASKDWPDSAFEATEGQPGRLSFLISLCVLQGAAGETIRQGASQLEQAIEDQLGPAHDIKYSAEHPPPPRKVQLPLSRRSMLQLFHAETFTLESSPTTERLRFSKQEEALSALEYVWKDFTGDLSDLIRSWMISLGSYGNPDMRLAVGNAVGTLIKTDFDAVSRQILSDWIRAPTTAPHLSIATVLSAALDHAEPGVARNVRQLAAGWSKTKRLDEQLLSGYLASSTLVDVAPDLATELTINLARQQHVAAAFEVTRVLRDRVLSVTRKPGRASNAFDPLVQICREPDPNTAVLGYISAIGFLDRLALDSNAGKSLRSVLVQAPARHDFADVLAMTFRRPAREFVQTRIPVAIRAGLEHHIKLATAPDGRTDIWPLLEAIALALKSDRESVERFRDWLLKRRENTIARSGASPDSVNRVLAALDEGGKK